MADTKTNAVPYWGNGHYYVMSDLNYKWWNAGDTSRNTILNGLNGYLATVTSYGENDFIYNHSNNKEQINKNVFLGGTDENNGYSSEGNWKWSDGPEYDEKISTWYDTKGGYSAWHSGEPNNSHNEDFLMMWRDHGTWNDADPDPVGGFITEWGKTGAEYNLSLIHI